MKKPNLMARSTSQCKIWIWEVNSVFKGLSSSESLSLLREVQLYLPHRGNKQACATFGRCLWCIGSRGIPLLWQQKQTLELGWACDLLPSLALVAVLPCQSLCSVLHKREVFLVQVEAKFQCVVGCFG